MSILEWEILPKYKGWSKVKTQQALQNNYTEQVWDRNINKICNNVQLKGRENPLQKKPSA